ncbi:gliding motility-associated C-terminal domain-containing protein [Myroides marinus]|uniref:gliding motility-associated C-terminal domain-containing protein n=1 Tax=Myroides marinus TaxID=703342 RepID=UPI0025769F48|nr:gliding motility-associated C-terminal domain-containing protein [Myroides marinus]MDM1348847.1 gliding motility-associated C-terminal domain-containing protein [Myroides marinus]MDM1349825.1 gliding motility-associated C-terminal domain-containing protein [Myroides marinus]MDM1353782.1 gliding motility-associated C-terminal domain-containing protein [Myroides marinus]MDM1357034.1 gliding motility-associated C-terminal domain-containing protein [Myroides marinus]MDM1361951.1 gliding motilit
MKKKNIGLVVLSAVPFVASAQTVNEGIFSVMPGTEMGTVAEFINVESGDFTNDGTVYFFNNFRNDGIYSISKNAKTGKVIFSRHEEESGVQTISGNSFTEFYDVVLNNPQKSGAFDLKANVDILGTMDFQDGIVKIDSTINSKTGLSQGMLTFQKGAKSINASDRSFADGEIEKIGNDAFMFPQGHKGNFRYAKISAPKSDKSTYVSRYIYDDKQFFEAHKNKTGVIEIVNTNEFWLVDKGNNTEGDVLLTLSWSDKTTLKDVLGNPEKNLHIIRWDEYNQIWVDEGGVVDVENKEVTTATTVNGYGFFTLATVKNDIINKGDVVIYNAVSPNGDGKNDYFIIDNITRYPNNKVQIFNRWGAKVYETSNYDSNGNVFKGYSEGSGTVNKNAKLPTGTYYYVVMYEYTDSKGAEMIKKTGYLHLENE